MLNVKSGLKVSWLIFTKPSELSTNENELKYQLRGGSKRNKKVPMRTRKGLKQGNNLKGDAKGGGGVRGEGG